MSMTMARLAVERGARDVFDKYFTTKDGTREDWEHYINLDDLDMGDPRLCVIGQMAPVISDLVIGQHRATYNDALRALDRAFGTYTYRIIPGSEECLSWAIRYGFDSGPDFTYADLQDAWTDEIQSRLDKLSRG